MKSNNLRKRGTEKKKKTEREREAKGEKIFN